MNRSVLSSCLRSYGLSCFKRHRRRTAAAAAVGGLVATGLVPGGAFGQLLTEDFNTEGEGIRYTSSAFDDGGSDFFERQTANPDPRHLAAFNFTAPQSGAYWSSEDIDDGMPSNPLGDHGIVRLNDLDVTGLNHLMVSVYLAQTDNRFDLNDKIEIQYALDGDVGGTDLTAGTYTTIGRFVGDTADLFGDGPMKMDTDLDGVVFGDPSDAGSATLDRTMRPYFFSIPVTGTTLSVQMRIEQNGGSEEIGFDHIQVWGDVAESDPPVLAAIEGSAVMYSEGDPATPVTQTLTVSDADSTTLEMATVRISAGFDPSEDALALGGPPAGLSAVWDSSNGVLSLAGTGSLAEYESALRAVTYQNLDASAPSTAIRTIQFQVSDGSNSSNLASRQIQIASVVAPGTLPYAESFETDGEGSRYTSSVFDNGGGDFFERAPSTGTFANADGDFLWASDDIESTGNPLGDHAIVRLPDLDTSGLGQLEVSLYLAELAPNSEGPEDMIEIQYAFDGDSGGTDLAAGSYTTVGRFVPASPDIYTTGPMTLDADLDGVTFGDPADASSPTLTSTLTQYTFSIPTTGNALSVQVHLRQNGGGEELGFDLIEVSGTPLIGSPPVLSDIEASPLAYAEGDPATPITQTLTVTDSDPSGVINATVQIVGNYDPSEDTLAFAGSLPSGFIVDPFDSASGLLNIIGVGTAADYEAIMRGVVYENTDLSDPSPATRSVRFQVIDGDLNVSNIQMREITVAPRIVPVTAPYLEDFDSDGQGVRYTASSFNTGAVGNAFFERVDTNPDPRHGGGFVFTAPQGAGFWASEGVANAANPLATHGIVRLPDMDVSRLANPELEIYLAQGADKFDLLDQIEIQYAYNDDVGGADLTAGHYTILARFVGATATIFEDGPLTADADLDGVADAGGAALSPTMQSFKFPIPEGGTWLSVQIRIEQNGGSEDIAFDQISITGDPAVMVENTNAAGPGSLRQAMADVPFGGFVRFVPALDGATIELAGAELIAASGQSFVIDASTLPRGLTIDGNGRSRIFSFSSGGPITLTNLTLTGGNGSGSYGGAIFYTNVPLTLRRCTLHGNYSPNLGGALAYGNYSGQVTRIEDCTISGNRSLTAGGGIYGDDGRTELISSTVADNDAPTATGGGVASYGYVGAEFVVQNSIIAGNRGDDVSFSFGSTNTFISSGHNLIGTGAGTPAFTAPGDTINVLDPALSPLACYGGPTPVHHPLVGSPAIDTGDSSMVDPDQRGFPRMVDGGSGLGAISDRGAVEAGPVLLVTSDLNAGAGTLRDQMAAATAPGTRILFDGGAFPGGFTTVLSSQIGIDGKTLLVDGVGVGGDGVVIEGGGNVRLFEVANDATAAFRSLSLTGGNTGGSPGRDGGALRNFGVVTVDRCTFAANEADDRGGAIFSAIGSSTPMLCVLNATFAANSAVGTGGALCNEGAARLLHSTVSGNNADGEGGGIFNAGELQLRNSIVAGNRAATADVDLLSSGPGASIASRGGNVIGTNANVAGTFPTGVPNLHGDRVGSATVPLDPRLGVLGDFGGPTRTLRPIAGSPAIDAAVGDSLPRVDQRGSPRSSGLAPDSGAVELVSLVVNTAVDENDGVATGLISLRDAVGHVASPEVELITFDPTAFPATISLLPGNGPISISNRDLAIDASAVAKPGVVVSGGNSIPIFGLGGASSDVSMAGLRLTDGRSSGGGAMTVDAASLTLVESTLTDNASIGHGGAILLYGGGTVHFIDSLIADNTADALGGALMCFSGDITAVNSTFTGNVATGNGAVFWIQGSSSLSLRHSTLTKNTGSSTVLSFVGGLLENTILAGNSGGAFSASTPTLAGNNLLSGDPLLAPLGDFGGATMTMPPLPGSPAIGDAILLPSTPLVDQRGAMRPNGSTPDLGAVEAVAFSLLGLASSDGDSIPDILEGAGGPYGHLDPLADDAALDSDGDGVTDADEIEAMTNPLDGSDFFRIASLEMGAEFVPLENEVFTLTLATFPGLEYAIETDGTLLNFLLLPGSTFVADDYLSTLELTFDLGQPVFVRARRNEWANP